jgi:hypothetical protein
MTNLNWQLSGTVASLESNGCSIAIDLCKPGHGVRIVGEKHEAASALHILGFAYDASHSFDLSRLDAYSRERDLVAVYEEAAPKHLRAQAYWRCLKPEEFFPDDASRVVLAFDMILSVNTSRLEIDPQVAVRSTVGEGAELIGSRLPATENLADPSAARNELIPAAAKPATNTVLARLPGGKLSYLEMVHPVDACESWTVTGTANTEINHLLFQRKLEKGVILKARVRAAIIDRQADEEVALNAYLRFAATEPPLTV